MTLFYGRFAKALFVAATLYRFASNQGNRSANLKPAPSRRYHSHIHGTEEEHRTAEEFSWRTSLIFGWVSTALNFCIAGGAVVAAVYSIKTFQSVSSQTRAIWQTVADGQKVLSAANAQATAAQAQVAVSEQQNRIAAQALISANRAWLNLSVPQGSASLTWIGNIAKLDADPLVKNIGQGPALDVAMSADLEIGGSVVLETTIESFCHTVAGFGPTLFPGEPYNFPNHKDILLKPWDLEAYLDRFPDHGMRGKNILPINLLVCVRYDVPGDPAPHFTGRAFNVRNTFGGAGYGYVFEAVPPGSVLLPPINFGAVTD